ncbi:MAG: hypothetical protein HC933_06980 [Pleurocapsa sp. SU_196_0]|nr:hypothetical protein [Pleurocapsa sp. SU_196_0]
MTRIALIALGVLLALGVLVSVLPVNNKEALGDVRLEGVNLELYPAADSDAKWLFKASSVQYSPETRESQVKLEGIGRRLVNGKEDLEIKAEELVIDGNDNLRTKYAQVYIPRGCWTVDLRSTNPTAQEVVIDQNSGFRSPQATVSGPNFESKGGPLDAAFNLSDPDARYNLQNPDDSFVQGGTERCAKGKLLKE